jgi:OmpA-OmpF porin, OOP family
MEKRILAVLIAAWAGAATAQTYVTSGADGSVVTNGYGLCWQSGAAGGGRSVACPPAAAAGQSTAPMAQRTQLAQANPDQNRQGRGTATRGQPAAAAGATSRVGNPPPPSDGYVGSGAGVVATNPFGLCWRGGMEWSPDKAAAPCDAVTRAQVVAPPPVAAAPAPAPIAAAAPAAPPVVIEKITLNTDVLFGFNKAELTPAGEQKLDELAKSAQGANVDKVVLTGHADRIGSDDYNQKLSEERAQAVADYLASKGVDRSHLQVEAKGESEPVTGNQCDRLGPENNKNQKLIACLQPDRRVEAELLGSRQTAGTATAPAGAGTTSGGATPSSGSSSSTGTGSSSSTSGASGASSTNTSSGAAAAPAAPQNLSPGSAGSSSSNSGSANTK